MADLTSPGHSAVAVVYDAVIPDCRGIWCAAAGDLAVDMKGTGTSIVIKSVPAGTLLPIQANKVLTTGSTIAAANLLVFY